MTPPAALMSAIAASAPFLSWVPNEAYCPVIGPATPTVMSCADAVPAKDKLNATPASQIFFMPFSSKFADLLTSWSPRPRSLYRRHSVRFLQSGHRVTGGEWQGVLRGTHRRA